MLTVLNADAGSNQALLGVTDADPEPFSNGPPYAAALNQDGSIKSQGHPAPAGSTVSVFGTGFGPLMGSQVDGLVIAAPVGLQLPVDVLYSGAHPA